MPREIYVTKNDDDQVPCDFVAHGSPGYFSKESVQYTRSDIVAEQQAAIDELVEQLRIMEFLSRRQRKKINPDFPEKEMTDAERVTIDLIAKHGKVSE